MSTKELRDTFPRKDASARAVKRWIRSALAFRDVEPSEMDWVNNCIWIGNDLYFMHRKDIEEGLYSFDAPDETARVIARDIEQAKMARKGGRSFTGIEFVVSIVLSAIGIVYIIRKSSLWGLVFLTPMGVHWLLRYKLSEYPEKPILDIITDSLGFTQEQGPYSPYSPRKPRSPPKNKAALHGSAPRTRGTNYYQNSNSGKIPTGWS